MLGALEGAKSRRGPHYPCPNPACHQKQSNHKPRPIDIFQLPRHRKRFGFEFVKPSLTVFVNFLEVYRLCTGCDEVYVECLMCQGERMDERLCWNSYPTAHHETTRFLRRHLVLLLVVVLVLIVFKRGENESYFYDYPRDFNFLKKLSYLGLYILP